MRILMSAWLLPEPCLMHDTGALRAWARLCSSGVLCGGAVPATAAVAARTLAVGGELAEASAEVAVEVHLLML